MHVKSKSQTLTVAFMGGLLGWLADRTPRTAFVNFLNASVLVTSSAPCDLASLQGGYWITIARVPRTRSMVLTLLLLGELGQYASKID